MNLVESPESFDLIIDGEYQAATSGKVTEVKSPATGELVGTVAVASEADIARTIDSADAAFREWSAKTAYEREKIIKKATAYTRTQADTIGRLMALEQGKPFNQSRSEVTASCDIIDYFAAEAVRIEGTINPTEKANLRSYVVYQPVGVCAFITPWNYPVALLSWKLGPALATGCTVITKPTSITPMCPTAFCKAMLDGGIPAGVISVLNGSGGSVGEALMKSPKIKKVAMTGSTATGKRLMEAYGPTLNKISLELGGHCPAIVCEDADVKLAAKMIAYKGFRNLGQSCSSINRVYVHESLADALTTELKELAENMTIGDGVTDGSVDIGPMATADGVTDVQAHVDDAVSKGATLVTGGKKPDAFKDSRGNYYSPTLLTNCTHDMLVMREETFGPVVPCQTFTDLDDAIAKANDTTYGLVAYAFTKDMATTIKVTEELEAGTVCVNNGAVNTPYAPYAGWKESGFGVELSRKSVFEYLNTKHIKIAF